MTSTHSHDALTADGYEADRSTNRNVNGLGTTRRRSTDGPAVIIPVPGRRRRSVGTRAAI